MGRRGGGGGAAFLLAAAGGGLVPAGFSLPPRWCGALPAGSPLLAHVLAGPGECSSARCCRLPARCCGLQPVLPAARVLRVEAVPVAGELSVAAVS